MGYCAKGDGYIDFAGVLGEKEYAEVLDALKYAFEGIDAEHSFLPPKKTEPITSITLWHDSKYYGDVVEDALATAAAKGKIDAGCVSFIGEDDAIWRFIYKNGGWVEENGRPFFYCEEEYDELLKEIPTEQLKAELKRRKGAAQ